MKNLKLGKACLSITDGTHSTVVDDPTGKCYLLSCKNVKSGNIIITENDRKISYSTLIQLRQRTKMEFGDVLLTTVGTIGQTSYIKDINPNYEFQRSVAILKPNKDIILSRYLNFYLSSPKGQYSITSRVKGAVQQCLFLNDLKDIDLNIVNMPEQQHIVNILGSIDDKIENNEKKILNIKKLMMNLYEKISLNKPCVKIGNFTTEIKEQLNSRTSKAYSVINSGELVEQDSYFVRQIHSKDMYKYKVIRKYDFAYNPSRINIGSIAMFQHEFGAVSPIYIAFTCDKKFSYYINEFIKTPQFNKEICLRANGSVRQTVSYDSFYEIQIPLPDENDLIRYNNIYFKLQDVVTALKSENIKLNELKQLYLKKFFG